MPTAISLALPVGKKTSIRRDCDLTACSLTLLPNLVGKKTSIRRDCDVFPRFIKNSIAVGKKTSIRRDCDRSIYNLYFLSGCRKEDLN